MPQQHRLLIPGERLPSVLKGVSSTSPVGPPAAVATGRRESQSTGSLAPRSCGAQAGGEHVVRSHWDMRLLQRTVLSALPVLGAGVSGDSGVSTALLLKEAVSR